MNEFQQYYGQQFAPQQYGELAPQGFLGGLLGAPLGGLIGRGIGGLFGNANLGRQIGQAAGGIGGGFLPFSADPVAAAYAQQAQQQQLMQSQLGQLAPQGWFGNIIKSVGRPLGGMIGGAFGNAGLGNTIGGIAGQLGGMLPFAADPVAQAYAQQGLAPQGWFSDLWRKTHPYSSAMSPPIIAPLPQTQLGNLLPFGADPLSAAYAQQAQQDALLQQGLAPQGWFGNLIKNVAQPLGGAIGGAFGNAGLGNTIGGIASQLGGMLPFAADPVAQAYAQQAQLQQLQQLQDQGLAPQGWFGNIIKSVGRPLGGMIGGAFGNAGLGNTIGGIAGQLGGMLPFGADPVSAAYAQQAQLAQLAAQQANGALYGQPTLH